MQSVVVNLEQCWFHARSDVSEFQHFLNKVFDYSLRVFDKVNFAQFLYFAAFFQSLTNALLHIVWLVVEVLEFDDRQSANVLVLLEQFKELNHIIDHEQKFVLILNALEIADFSLVQALESFVKLLIESFDKVWQGWENRPLQFPNVRFVVFGVILWSVLF